jgi:two-component system, sensor histidine kinase PdtaS
VAQTMVNIGIVHKIQGSFEDASLVTLAAAKIFDSLGAVNELAAVYSTLGNIQKDLHRAEDALFYLEKSLKIRQEVNDSNGIAGALNNIGNVYRGQRQFEQALDYYLRSLAIKEKTGSLKSVGTTLTNMAECYIGLDDPGRAEMYLTRSLAMKAMAQDREGQISALNKLAKLYLSTGDLGKAKLLAERADSLLAGAGYLRQRSEHNLVLAGLAAKSGQFEKALSLTNRGIHLRDSMFDTEMADVVTKYNVRFKTAEKERALLLSRQMQQEQAYRLKTQSYLIVLLIFIVMLFSVVMYLLYRAAAYRKRAKQRVDLLMSELNHRVKNNLQILSGMLNMQMGTTTDDGQIALLEALDSRVASMGNLHALLYQEEYDGIIQIKGFFQSLLENLEQAYGGSRPKFLLSLEISEVGLHAKQAIPVGLIVNELLTNIYKYSKMPVNPVLRIHLSEIDGKCKMEISDNCGYWDKEQAISKGGLGLVLVDTLVTQLDAVYELRIDEKGTMHTIEFKKE